MDNKTVEFKGVPVKCVYSSPNFKTYAFDVDKKDYPSVALNKFGNVSVIGDISDLILDTKYEVAAVAEQTKYGISYRVQNIRRSMPTTMSESKAFLYEILSKNQAEVLFNNYPNIIDLVKNGQDNKVDLSKLNGIGEYTFGVIKRKIIENFKLADLVAEFRGVMTISMLRRIYDKYPDINKLREKLAEEPYSTLTKISGVGFKKADAIVLDLQKENIVDFGYNIKQSVDRCLACIVFLLQENENEGNTKMNLADLRKQCIEMIPECIPYFVEAIQSDDIYYNKEKMDIALSHTYKKEWYIAHTIADNIKCTYNIWDFDIEKYRSLNDFDLSDEQMLTLKNVCNCNISILNGPGGTGKSSSTLALINMLDDNHKSYMIFAPTGKAAKVISGYTNRRASTIHRGLMYSPRDGWGYNNDNKVSCDIVIVDESSMIDIDLFSHLIDAIDFTHTKLLLIGDNAQLPSVGCGNLFHDLIESKVVPSATLTKVHRYGEGGILTVATDTRFCKPYLDKTMRGKATWFGSNRDYVFRDVSPEDMVKTAVSIYKKLLDDGENIEDIQIITPKNVGDYGTVALNNMVQKAVNKNYGSEAYMKVGETTYYKGDIVIQKHNNYKAIMCDMSHNVVYGEDGKPETAFVANGESAIVRYACNSYVILDFDGILVKYEKSNMIDIGLGYAITTHKSQGSGIKNVILCSPKSDIWMLNSNLLYVGVTRSIKRCFHLGSINTVNMAIKKKANLKRLTFLQEMLLEENN